MNRSKWDLTDFENCNPPDEIRVRRHLNFAGSMTKQRPIYQCYSSSKEEKRAEKTRPSLDFHFLRLTGCNFSELLILCRYMLSVDSFFRFYYHDKCI
ncbi:hypothetical protein KP509_25G037200 [Ceratopteris richardii]|uniref:Uncharacterized protein n=1 Tax=Ceratopteris richardii TaxID=49495 RepID=A0A8T2RQD6_CERRI|nr:hypothetical protein KP509_25G037200 [Ceratopteris richardii]